MKKKLMIYGAGNRGKNLCELLMENPAFEILCVVDGSSEKWGKKLCGRFEISAPERIRSCRDAHICITVHNSRILQDIREKLEHEYHYDMAMEIEYEELVWSVFESGMSFQNNLLLQNSLHIIFDSYMGLGLGGIEAWTKDVCIALLDRGWKHVRILTDQHDYLIPEQLISVVDRVERTEDNETEDGIKNFLSLAGYFLERMPCTIITSRPNVELMAACTVKKKEPDKVKIISVIHMGTQDTYQKYAVFREWVDLYIGVSQDIREGMIKLGIPEKQVTSIACPFFCEEVLTRTYTTDRILPLCIGYAGRLDSITPAQKRMDLLLKFMQELADRKINFKLEIAGDGPAREAMEEFLRNKEWKTRVIFLGNITRTEISDFWKRQDVCINLADFEGRSISIIEAMGNGAVPVVTLTSGVQEDVEDGRNGYHIPLGDYHVMADRIEYLEETRERLPEMGQAAHDKVYPKSLLSVHLDFWERILGE